MPAPFPTLDEAQRLPVDTLAIHVLWYLADIAPKYDQRSSFLLRRLREYGGAHTTRLWRDPERSPRLDPR